MKDTTEPPNQPVTIATAILPRLLATTLIVILRHVDRWTDKQMIRRPVGVLVVEVI